MYFSLTDSRSYYEKGTLTRLKIQNDFSLLFHESHKCILFYPALMSQIILSKSKIGTQSSFYYLATMGFI